MNYPLLVFFCLKTEKTSKIYKISIEKNLMILYNGSVF